MGSCFSYSPGTSYSRVKFMTSLVSILLLSTVGIDSGVFYTIQYILGIISCFPYFPITLNYRESRVMYSSGTLFAGFYFPDSPGTFYSKEEQVYIFLILQVLFTVRKEQVYIFPIL